MELEFEKQRTTSERTRQRQYQNQQQYQQRQQYYQRQQNQQRQQKSEKTQIDDDLPKLLKWWDVLGVGSTDTKADIKAAYRRLAKQYHPDCKNYSPKKSKEKMQLSTGLMR